MTMQALGCDTCGRKVLVEKFSQAHTSIQWTTDASECPLISASSTRVGDPRRGCPSLRKSIDEAVRSAELGESCLELPVGAGIPRLH